MSAEPSSRSLPRALEPVRGPIDPDVVRRCVATLGPDAKASHALLESGLVTPSALTPLTLVLLSGQPRHPVGSVGSVGAGPGSGRVVGARAVAGGVWVRERITYHRPMRIGEDLVIRGETLQRVARKGRLFTTTRSRTFDASGRLLVTSVTTGLSRYRPDPELADREEGQPPEPTGADFGTAAANPSAAAIAALAVGARLTGPPIDVTLELLRNRDGERPGNPIHTDPEVARREGLAAPIAGGSHVLGFVQESLMNALGPECLLHGASFDVRFKAPVPAGTRAERYAELRRRAADRLELELRVSVAGKDALVGEAVLPTAG